MELIKYADGLTSRPPVFYIGDKNSHKTCFGGLLTALFILLVGIYGIDQLS